MDPPDEPSPLEISPSTLVGIKHSLFPYSLLNDAARCLLHFGCAVCESNISGSRECEVGLECCIHRREYGWNSDEIPGEPMFPLKQVPSEDN